jgi:hypothetical protein
MTKKVVAVSSVNRHAQDDSVVRLLDIMLSQDGVIRTNEKWVWDAARPLVATGVLNSSKNVLSFGAAFETFLINFGDVNPSFKRILFDYRSLIAERVKEFDLSSDEVTQNLMSLTSTDDKIIYLTSVISSTFAKMEKMIEKTQALEAAFSEMDTALSVVETIAFNEDSDR